MYAMVMMVYPMVRELCAVLKVVEPVAAKDVLRETAEERIVA